MSRINLSRIRKLETADKRLLDVARLTDEELMAIIEESLANDHGRDTEKFDRAMVALVALA